MSALPTIVRIDAAAHGMEARERLCMAPAQAELAIVVSSGEDLGSVDFAPAASLRRVHDLEQELRRTREKHRALAADMQLAQEETRAENLQLLAMNAELRQANESLASLNRELQTLSEEFLAKIDELGQQSREMDRVLENAAVGVMFLDNQLCIRRFSPGVTRAFNLLPCDRGRPLEHISYNFEHPQLLQEVRSVLATGKCLDREVRLKDHSSLLLRVQPHGQLANSRDGVVVALIDVSASKQAQAALEQSEQRYRDLAESSLDALFIFSTLRDQEDSITGFTFVDLNSRGEQLLSVPREEILGRRLGELLPVPEGQVLERFQQVAETGRPLVEEFSCRNALGHTVWLQHQVIRFLDGIAITTRDITERKRADAALQESEERLQGILENNPAAIYLKDLQGRYLLANRRFCELFGLSLAPGQYWTDNDFLPPTLAAQFRHNDQQVLQAGDTLECEEVLHHLQPPHTYLTVRFPVRDAMGQVYAVAGIMTDITVRKGIELLLADRAAQLSQANAVLHGQNKELDDFTYMASHDLQEPLRTMRIYSDLLAADLGGTLPAAAAQDLEFITGAAKQMQRLLDDLLSLSRTSRADMQPRRFPLTRCVAQAITNLSARLKQADAQVSVAELPEVLGDETLLVQLFQNLIGNAVKFRDPQRLPSVEVTAQRQEGGWLVRVRDNGIGINPEHREKVFAPFQKLHSRTEHEGSGIGLAICRKVVERHKGRLGVDSTPGEGSTFWFTLTDSEADA